jgi:uncharacterized protein (DUF2141 family)
MNRKRMLLAATGALFLFAAGCSNKTAQTSPVESSGAGKGTAPASTTAKQADVALVRFINGTTSDKDLAFGDTTPFPGVGDRDVTAYKQLPAERHDFKLYAKDNKNSVLATNSEGLSAGKHYTILAVNEKDGKVTLDPISDDLVPPDPGKAKVRVINLAPGMENVDLYAEGNKSPLISGAGLDHPTSYKDVDPTEAALAVRHGMSKKNAAIVKDFKIEAGKLYTVLVFQDKNGKLKVKTVEDQFTAAPNGGTS